MKKLISFLLFAVILLLAIAATSVSAKAENLQLHPRRVTLAAGVPSPWIGESRWQHNRRGHWHWAIRLRPIHHRRANRCVVL